MLLNTSYKSICKVYGSTITTNKNFFFGNQQKSSLKMVTVFDNLLLLVHFWVSIRLAIVSLVVKKALLTPLQGN